MVQGSWFMDTVQISGQSAEKCRGVQGYSWERRVEGRELRDRGRPSPGERWHRHCKPMKFTAYAVTEALSVEALTKMTQQILQLFDQFIAGAHSAIAEEGGSSPAMNWSRVER